MSDPELTELLDHAVANRDADAMLRAGARALRSGQWVEAAQAADRVLADHADNARLWQLRGLLARNLEDYAAAVPAFAKAAALMPDDPMIALSHASASLEAGLPAVDLLEKVLALSGPNQGVELQLTAARIAIGDDAAAIAGLANAVARDPQWVQGHSVLAATRWKHGQRDRFAESFRQAIGQSPRSLPLWRGLIEAHLTADLFEAALEVITEGRAAVGDHVTFDAAEAIARTELGDLARAERMFSRLADVHDIAVTVSHLRYLLRAGRIEEAAAIAEQAAATDTTNQVWPYLSVAWRMLGDPRWTWLEGDPAFVGVYDLSAALAPIEELAELLRRIHTAIGHPLKQSLRNGTQTDGHLFWRTEPEIGRLRDAVRQAVEAHVAQLPPPEPGHPLLVERRGPIGFAGSWSVRLTAGGHHIEHFHPAGWISSALYIALPENFAADSDAGFLSLGEVNDLGLDLGPIRKIEPKVGQLVLFPSYMWHGTRPFDAGERLTVAFDVKRPA